MSVHRQAPSVTVSSTDREITAHGGAVLLRETARAVGLAASVTLLAASASYGLGALVVVPLVRSVAGGGGGGPTVLP